MFAVKQKQETAARNRTATPGHARGALANPHAAWPEIAERSRAQNRDIGLRIGADAFTPPRNGRKRQGPEGGRRQSGFADCLSRQPIAVSLRSFLRRNGWSQAARPEENICRTDIFLGKML